MSNRTKKAPVTVSPSRLAHVVLRTSNLKEMSLFYKTFLGGKAQVESDQVAFITYDDEHHRLALVQRSDLQKLPPKSCGLDVCTKALIDPISMRLILLLSVLACSIWVWWYWKPIESILATQGAWSHAGLVRPPRADYKHVLPRPGWQRVGNIRRCFRWPGEAECVYDVERLCGKPNWGGFWPWRYAETGAERRVQGEYSQEAEYWTSGPEHCTLILTELLGSGNRGENEYARVCVISDVSRSAIWQLSFWYFWRASSSIKLCEEFVGALA